MVGLLSSSDSPRMCYSLTWELEAAVSQFWHALQLLSSKRQRWGLVIICNNLNLNKHDYNTPQVLCDMTHVLFHLSVKLYLCVLCAHIVSAPPVFLCRTLFPALSLSLSLSLFLLSSGSSHVPFISARVLAKSILLHPLLPPWGFCSPQARPRDHALAISHSDFLSPLLVLHYILFT